MSRLDVEVENEVEKAEEVKKQHPTNGVRLHYIPNSPSGGRWRRVEWRGKAEGGRRTAIHGGPNSARQFGRRVTLSRKRAVFRAVRTIWSVGQEWICSVTTN